MENKSIGNGVKAYLVTTISMCGKTLENFVTLDEKLAVEKAFDMYEAYNRENVFVETLENNIMIKLGYIIKEFSNMENKSIGKNSINNGIEIYSVTAVFPNGEILETFVTLDRKIAVEKAFDMNDFYCEFDAVEHSVSVVVDTWKDNELIKIECILDGKLIIEEKFD